MCGIAGLFCYEKPSTDLPQTLREMSLRLRHRGPDDEGFVLFSEEQIQVAGSNHTQSSAWNAPFPYAPVKQLSELNGPFTLGLAHRRLSVIDLTEAGHQPMCNADQTLWIVCNGEIYNQLELKQELQALGHTFRTRSDMEVLLKAYEQWGVRCLDKLNGMWSFVIYDKKQHLLFGARDRFGVKPLYYFHNQNCFAFASEQKSLLAVPQLSTGVNRAAVYEHLLLGQVELREEGFFQNILELKPAHSFTLDLDTHRLGVRKYYNLSFLTQDERPDQVKYNDAVEMVREKVIQAIDLRLASEVPVGFCLSGGIDSSSIVCIAENIRKERAPAQLSSKLHTFTAVNTGGASDEAGWAKQVVDSTGSEWHHAHCVPEDILPALEQLVYHQDVPLYSTSTFAQSRVMKAARENGMTILLDGQGGDELFSGYQTFYTSLLWNDLRNGHFTNFLHEFSSLKNSPASSGIFFRSLIKLAAENTLSAGVKDKLASRYRPELAYFSKDARSQYSGLLNLAGEFSTLPVNNLLHQYFTGYYLKNLLRWEDRCSMQYSIESRTPFADDINLIEAVFSLPSSFKIRHGWSKALLRDAMKGIIPDPIRLRTDKLGFATPQTEWLIQINKEMKETISGLISHDDSGIINHQKLLKEWDTIFSRPSLWKARDFAFRYLNFLIWKKQFF